MHIHTLHALNKVMQTNHATNNWKHGSINTFKHTTVNLAQANNFRSGERNPLPKLIALA